MDIRGRVLGALVAALVIGALVAAPGFASAEEAPSSASPSIEASPLSEESCESGDVCAWPRESFQGNRWSHRCEHGGYTPFGSNYVYSVKNRCPSRPVFLNYPSFCIGPNSNYNAGIGIHEVFVGNVNEAC
jgi:hypothetical protein